MKDNNEIILPEKKSAAVARKEYLHSIADKIQHLVESENINPNDIMVLVQRRNPFASPLIKELKSRNINVAGNDRIILPEFPAIRDLLNLLRFCLSNDDDYSLCCTLKNPFYRLNERDIFNICKIKNERNKIIKNNKISVTVFDILKETYPDIYSELFDFSEISKTLAPYSFFTKILNTNNNREKLISALGTQVIDPLEEFMTICLAYERTQPGTLRHFIKWFIVGGSEIKRDMDSSNGIRIVTVHGSKGLEAPVVFLIDTITTPRDKPEKIFMIEPNVNNINTEKLKTWLWSPQKSNSEKLKQVSELMINKKISEYYRLLYVAMTRARDRLYIYGFTSNKNPPEIAWHTQLVNILSNISGSVIKDGDIKVSNNG